MPPRRTKTNPDTTTDRRASETRISYDDGRTLPLYADRNACTDRTAKNSKTTGRRQRRDDYETNNGGHGADGTQRHGMVGNLLSRGRPGERIARRSALNADNDGSFGTTTSSRRRRRRERATAWRAPNATTSPRKDRRPETKHATRRQMKTPAPERELCVKTAATQRGRTGITEDYYATGTGAPYQFRTSAQTWNQHTKTASETTTKTTCTNSGDTKLLRRKISFGTVRGRVRFLSGGRLRTTNNNQRSR